MNYNNDQFQIITGSLLGDASLTRPKRNSNFRVSHRLGDQDYITWKYLQLKVLDEFHLAPYRDRTRPNMLHLRSRSSPFFTEFREIFYPGGKKVVPSIMLEKLNELGLAVWYMDDGYLGYKKLRKNGEHPYYIKLATCGFTFNENCLIREWFADRYKLQFIVTPWGRNYLLRLRKSSQVERFLEAVRPYIVQVPSMRRKVSKRHAYPPSNPTVLPTL